MSSSRNRVFAFETPEQAWSFVNLASTAGYTMFEGVSPTLVESAGQTCHVPVPHEYASYIPDLKRISRATRAATNNTMNEHTFSFDKFINENENRVVMVEGDAVVDISTANEFLLTTSLRHAQELARHGYNNYRPNELKFKYKGTKYSPAQIQNLQEMISNEEPMRLRARRHQELPQNRIRMVSNG